jgi:outer membrane receptor protein involved in Fe transport
MFPSDLVGDRQGRALRGTYSADQAVDKLLDGTELVADHRSDVILIRGRAIPSATDANTPSADIVVTGTRIRGALVASPTIRLSATQLEEQGYSSLADAVRQIPQNFGGSQNPGAGLNVPERNGTSVGAGSSLDLRGIGGDATLTLLNGHRLAYTGALQAIDISTIPLAALDRIEIVADGSSALYGSDAVAGVANIVLRKDFDGLAVSSRIGGTTDGGGLQQQYDVTAGRTGRSGGFMLAYDHSDTAAINASDRNYARDVSPGLTLLPRIVQNSLIGVAHETLGPVTASVDGFYNQRSSARYYAVTDEGDPTVDGGAQLFRSKSFSVAPRIDYALDNGWIATLQGSYSDDETRYRVYSMVGGVAMYPAAGCYCNKEVSAEAHAEGPLFHLGGGDARLAFGGGLRVARYHGFRTEGSDQDIDVSQHTYFGYGEINLPFVSASNATTLLRRVNVSAAVRYEDYPGIDQVVTPKVGLIYSPIEGVDIKGTWGKSFKAPTFYERYSAQSVYAYDIGQLGGVGYPSGTTALYVAGGNPNLKPERATTWSSSLSIHPIGVKGLHVDLSYFHIDYRDRIIAPIPYLSTVLKDPALARYVTLQPSAAEVSDALAGRDFFDISSSGYNPAEIGALVNGVDFNAARQRMSGVDVAIEYTIALGGSDKLNLNGSATYLRSKESLSAGEPETRLAGTIFNPPHVRARGGVTWIAERGSVSTFLNYNGPIDDVRSIPSYSVRGMTTWDVSATRNVRLSGFGPKTLSLSVSISNLLDQAPARIMTEGVYETPYDPLNGSPVGRLISGTVGIKW